MIAQNLRDLAWLRPRLSTSAQWELIPPSVLPKLLDASFEARPIAERNPAEMLFFASWNARKGSYYVPRAFRLIREQLPNMRLTIWGGGKEVGSVLSEFEDRDRANVTIVPGVITPAEQIERFGDFSIFLFPSLSEGFGLALLEACCFGLAPVTTSVGFGGDSLTDGESARVVFPSTEHIVRAAIDLATSDVKRNAIAAAAQSIARKYTVDTMVDRYEECFHRAVARLRSVRPVSPP